MRNAAKIQIAYSSVDFLVLRDLGPWDQFPTITNDAENVVARVAKTLDGRRLFYIDSDGRIDELLVSDAGKFVGFAAGAPQALRAVIALQETVR